MPQRFQDKWAFDIWAFDKWALVTNGPKGQMGLCLGQRGMKQRLIVN